MCINVCVHGCVCVCMGVCVCAWVCVCVHGVCMCAWVCVHRGVCAWGCVCHGGVYTWVCVSIGPCVRLFAETTVATGESVTYLLQPTSKAEAMYILLS